MLTSYFLYKINNAISKYFVTDDISELQIRTKHHKSQTM